MLAELSMKIKTNTPNFGYYQSSNLQGVLMEQIDANYARQLHEQGLKPYSQYVLIGDQNEWIVKTCTKKAYQEIILPLLNERFTQFTIKKKDIQVNIQEKNLKTMEKKQLLNEFYSDTSNHYLNFEFLSPVSFKSNNRYIIMPEMRYIYQSLMNKYSAASTEMDMYDEETLEQLVNNSSVIRYKLRSVFFPMEGIRVPSFKGEMSVKIAGTDTMARYARLLFRFGEYSGVGIKTAMGMGALKIKEKEPKNDG